MDFVAGIIGLLALMIVIIIILTAFIGSGKAGAQASPLDPGVGSAQILKDIFK